MKDKVCLVIENQFHEIKTKIASEQIRVSRKFEIELFEELKTRVSEFAMEELYRQYELAISNELPFECKNHFQMTMGLPCSHMIKIAMDKGEPLRLGDIHPQWRIDTRSFVDGTLEDDEISCLLEKLR
ncbi:hypothetical protein LIER_30994 [Lithospermum erythrorhizon]|uniref:Protein FAR1-RELATED SEQUENCE n=1 Tax=Lithospermum erythrorhizon TaxID=34254 RepID=A0AAV3RUU2_LITER